MYNRLVWTAMRRSDEGYSFVTNHDVPVKYTNWGKGFAIGQVFGDCVVVWQKAMYRHDCRKPANFVCERKA
jgi:hypothetical protein